MSGLRWLITLLVAQTVACMPHMRMCSDNWFDGQCQGECVETVLPSCCRLGLGTISFSCVSITGEVAVEAYHNSECRGGSLWRRNLPSHQCLTGLPKLVHFSGCSVVDQDPCQYKKCQAHQVCRVHRHGLGMDTEPYCADTCANNGPCVTGLCELVPTECERQPCPPVARCVDRSLTMRPAFGDCRPQFWRDLASSRKVAGSGAECLATLLQDRLDVVGVAVYHNSTGDCWGAWLPASQTAQVASCVPDTQYETFVTVQVKEYTEGIPVEQYPARVTLQWNNMQTSVDNRKFVNISGTFSVLTGTVEHMAVICTLYNMSLSFSGWNAAQTPFKSWLWISLCDTATPNITLEGPGTLWFWPRNVSSNSGSQNGTNATVVLLLEDSAPLAGAEQRMSTNCLPWVQGDNSVGIAVSAVQCERLCLSDPACLQAVFVQSTKLCYQKAVNDVACHADSSVVTFHHEDHCRRLVEELYYAPSDLKIHMASDKARGFDITATNMSYLLELCVHTNSLYSRPTVLDVYVVVSGQLLLLSSTNGVQGKGELDTCFLFDAKHKLVKMIPGNRYLLLYHNNGRQFSMKVKYIDRAIGAGQQQGMPTFGQHVSLEQSKLVNGTPVSDLVHHSAYVPVFHAEFCVTATDGQPECDVGKYGKSCEFTCPAMAGATPCSGHGTCRDGRDGDGSCTCQPGWAGSTCSTEAVGGASLPCNGRGASYDGAEGDGRCTCYDNDWLGHWTDYDCTACASGWEGSNCRAPVCMDGAVKGSERCDDGNPVDEDCCSNTCTITPGCHCNTTTVANKTTSACARVVLPCGAYVHGFAKSILGFWNLASTGVDTTFVQESAAFWA